MDGVILTPLKQIYHPKGDIFHAMKSSDIGFDGFGEAYFSNIGKDDIKGWKRHTRMTLNLVVPVGEIEFVVYNQNLKEFLSVTLSNDNYKRLTIKPGLWLSFRGISDNNLLLNIASIEHDPNEAENIDLNEIKFYNKKLFR
jgi:dTDP-4-dehydrorhamnose 3,5-epimerase